MSGRDILDIITGAQHEFCDGPYATGDPELDHWSVLADAADEITSLRSELASARQRIVDLESERDAWHRLAIQ